LCPKGEREKVEKWGMLGIKFRKEAVQTQNKNPQITQIFTDLIVNFKKFLICAICEICGHTFLILKIDLRRDI